MNLRPFRDLRLYGECGWNDTCCSTSFVPKWAASSRLAGVQLIGLFGHEGQEAGFEWAGTSTQSFTHSQFCRGYRARGSVISHVIGIDGEDYFAPLTDRFGRAVMLGVEVDRAVVGSAKHLAPVALKEGRIGARWTCPIGSGPSITFSVWSSRARSAEPAVSGAKREQ